MEKVSGAILAPSPALRNVLRGRILYTRNGNRPYPVENGQADPLFWVESNHQALCRNCHSYKTRVIDQRGYGSRKMECDNHKTALTKVKKAKKD